LLLREDLGRRRIAHEHIGLKLPGGQSPYGIEDGESMVIEDEQETVHYFLLAAMQQREWEWFQFKDGVTSRASA
jgi:hypothetical protein